MAEGRKPILVAGVIAGAALLGVGGYFLQGKMKCSGLEEDYLNDISSLRGNAIIQSALPGNAELAANLDELNELQLKSIERSLKAVYDECGARAGATAARKGTELMFGA